MSMRSQIGGEVASKAWFPSGPGTTGLVACPTFAPGVGRDAAAVREIYRLAYEGARAASRPSAYEMALRASCN